MMTAVSDVGVGVVIGRLAAPNERGFLNDFSAARFYAVVHMRTLAPHPHEAAVSGHNRADTTSRLEVTTELRTTGRQRRRHLTEGESLTVRGGCGLVAVSVVTQN